jgi:luciferase family oxidoreductase group 1
MKNEKKLETLPYSILDLAVITEGATVSETLAKSLDIARHVENLGYTRFWLAEHHNMINVASSATSVLIGYIAGGTNSIRVGSGGVMLPNHSPLIIAEQFGTLENLYPGRIDLGLGRAPGTDQLTAHAIRGSRFNAMTDFPQDVLQLQTYFSKENSSARVRAIPGEGADIPIWILGSSTDSAHLAAGLGLPYAFASHFAPAQFNAAITIYRQNFKPSAHLKEPYVMACVNVIAADTDSEANKLATSLFQMFKGIATGDRRYLQPPVEKMEAWTEYEEAVVNQMLSLSFIGGPETIKRNFQQFLNDTQIDEVMISTNIYDHKAKLHSYEVFAEILKNN